MTRGPPPGKWGGARRTQKSTNGTNEQCRDGSKVQQKSISARSKAEKPGRLPLCWEEGSERNSAWMYVWVQGTSLFDRCVVGLCPGKQGGQKKPRVKEKQKRKGGTGHGTRTRDLREDSKQRLLDHIHCSKRTLRVSGGHPVECCVDGRCHCDSPETEVF